MDRDIDDDDADAGGYWNDAAFGEVGLSAEIEYAERDDGAMNGVEAFPIAAPRGWLGGRTIRPLLPVATAPNEDDDKDEEDAALAFEGTRKGTSAARPPDEEVIPITFATRDMCVCEGRLR